MAQLRIAMAQVNPTVGDFSGNSGIVVERTREAAQAGAHLVVFPEMVVTGYPVEDLALRNSFVSESIRATRSLAERLADEGVGDLPVVVGFLARNEGGGEGFGQSAGPPRNAMALLHRGAVRLVSAKHHLPNHGVFDEVRTFVPGDTLSVVRVGGVDVAFVVGEDLWGEGGPVAAAREARAGMVVSINGSPYERGKDNLRLELCQRRARETGVPVGYVNMTGAQDEMVFDGDSLIVDSEGELVARASRFDDTLLVTDLRLREAIQEGPSAAQQHSGIRIARYTASGAPFAPYAPLESVPAPRPNPISDVGEVYQALVTGLRDYAVKNGFPSVLVALSGGIDSALTAAIAVDALGAANVHGLLLPSKYSTDHSLTDAEELVRRQGINAHTVHIQPVVDAFENAIDVHGLAAENLQARVRGMLVMSLSNEEGHLVLATGNKSELATGYSTLYGDSVGGYAPLKDCWKTLVWELAWWRDEEAERVGEIPPIPERSITKPPSAELRPDQYDTDTLPDYALLDALLDAYVGNDRGPRELTAAGFDPALVERVTRLVDRAEYKRRQYPPGPRVSSSALSRDRRLPMTNRRTP